MGRGCAAFLPRLRLGALSAGPRSAERGCFPLGRLRWGHELEPKSAPSCFVDLVRDALCERTDRCHVSLLRQFAHRVAQGRIVLIQAYLQDVAMLGEYLGSGLPLGDLDGHKMLVFVH